MLNGKQPDRTSSASRAAPVLLLTGRPGTGKTTTLRQVVAALDDRAGGFYTRELRAGGQRTGFELVTLAGETALLATVDPQVTLAHPRPFGRYRLDLETIEAVGVPALLEALERGQVVVVNAASAPRSDRWRSCRYVSKRRSFRYWSVMHRSSVRSSSGPSPSDALYPRGPGQGASAGEGTHPHQGEPG